MNKQPDVLDVSYYDSSNPERNFRHVRTREPAPEATPESPQFNQVYVYAGFAVLLLLILFMGVFINGKQPARNSNANQAFEQPVRQPQSGSVRQASGSQTETGSRGDGVVTDDRDRGDHRGDRDSRQPDYVAIILQLKDGQITTHQNSKKGGSDDH